MHFKIVQYKESMYANFWVVPLIMSLFAVMLAFSLLYLDQSILFPHIKTELNYIIGQHSAREVLSIIANSVITVASVTFSITVLTLSIASNQLGPRLLPNFMRQKPTQIVLGFFNTSIFIVIKFNFFLF